MANYTKNQFLQSLKDIENAIINKSGVVKVANINPTPAELKAGVDSIPNGSYVTNSTGYAIQCAELNGITMTLKLGDSVVASQTTPSPNGGLVIFAPTAPGLYTIVATNADGSEKWANTVLVTGIGTYICKSSLAMNTYTFDEINLICKNKYAKYMFVEDDYFDMGSFMGSTSTDYRYARLVDLGNQVDKDGNEVGATFATWTPSTYKMNTSYGNGLGYKGSEGYSRLLPTGTETYIWKGTLSSTTEGTYYTYDALLDIYEEKTLPAEWVANTAYYAKEMSLSTIYEGFPENIREAAVPSRQQTWQGVQYGVTAINDTTVITTAEKFWMPSANQWMGYQRRGWSSYKEDLEGVQFSGLAKKNSFTKYGGVLSSNAWFRSPYVTNAGSFCHWSSNYGNVSYNYASYAFRPLVCFCL